MRISSALVWLLVGCLSVDPTPDVGSRDASIEPEPRAARLIDWSVTDYTGREWEAERAPRRPRVVFEFDSSLNVDDAVFVFDAEGIERERLEDDLMRAPLLVAHERRRVLTEVAGDTFDQKVQLEPATLEPGRRYFVALGAWAQSDAGVKLEAPIVRELSVRSSGGGAVVLDSWPPAGAHAVPTGLRFAAIRFDGEVSGIEAIRVEGPEGPIHAEASFQSCRAIGWASGVCVRLDWSGPLRPHREYRWTVSTEVLDRGGAPIGPWQGTFETGTSDEPPIAFLSTPCGVGEREASQGCARDDDDAVVVRLRTAMPVRAFFTNRDRASETVSPRGETTIRLAGLGPSYTGVGTLRLEGYASTLAVIDVELTTSPPLPTLELTEVRANPRGPEPQQEYVELLNYGTMPLMLDGLWLADRSDREGDPLPAQSLAPGARALIVGPDFDPEHADDTPAVMPGTALIRLDGSIASGGLSNRGEPLFLRDLAGHWLSHVPALQAPSGLCWSLNGTPRRDPAPEQFVIGECTPGRP